MAAVEINLRNGDTTHPALTLLALTQGEYVAESGAFVADGTPKHYVATDHLEVPGLRSLTPDDILDVAGADGVGWDSETLTGSVFHMVSGVGVAGRIGVTAIADSDAAADAAYRRVEACVRTVATGAGAHEGA
jgi:hypothetical protein